MIRKRFLATLAPQIYTKMAQNRGARVSRRELSGDGGDFASREADDVENSVG
jgi:hypothetical protein